MAWKLCGSLKEKAHGAAATAPCNWLPLETTACLSAGVSGYEIEYDSGESEPIFMARRWFDAHHYRPEMLLAIKVTGRSMEPSLYDGDLVIVNTEDTALKDGCVFAANYEGELVIKRLRRDAGEWFLVSDSPDKRYYADKRCSDGCGLIGRIVYRQTEHI